MKIARQYVGTLDRKTEIIEKDATTKTTYTTVDPYNNGNYFLNNLFVTCAIKAIKKIYDNIDTVAAAIMDKAKFTNKIQFMFVVISHIMRMDSNYQKLGLFYHYALLTFSIICSVLAIHKSVKQLDFSTEIWLSL